MSKAKESIMTIPFRISILLLFLSGMHTWITWDIPEFGMYLIVSLISLLYKKENNIKFRYGRREIVAFLLFFIAYLYAGRGAWRTSIFIFVFQFYPILVLISDKNVKKTAYFVVKWFAILLVPSMIIYILTLFIALPNFGEIRNEASENYVYINYIFYLQSVYTLDYSRFQAFTLEPGYLGTGCAFLLYLVRYNFNSNYNKIIGVALLLSLSLAGIVISVIGYLICQVLRGKRVRKLLISIASLIAIICFFQNYNGGANIVNDAVLSRLEIDKDKGIKGNNRFSETADKYYDKLFKSNKFIFGYGGEYINKVNHNSTGKGNFQDQIRGAGYKIYILYNGILGLILCILFYWFFVPLVPLSIKRYMIGFFILIMITGVQATYPFSYSWLIPYLLGTRLKADE